MVSFTNHNDLKVRPVIDLSLKNKEISRDLKDICLKYTYIR